VTPTYAVLAFAITAALLIIGIRIARRRRDTPRKDEE
jgi:membrane protein implicated in regulation of membrane protease activity